MTSPSSTLTASSEVPSAPPDIPTVAALLALSADRARDSASISSLSLSASICCRFLDILLGGGTSGLLSTGRRRFCKSAVSKISSLWLKKIVRLVAFTNRSESLRSQDVETFIADEDRIVFEDPEERHSFGKFSAQNFDCRIHFTTRPWNLPSGYDSQQTAMGLLAELTADSSESIERVSVVE